MAETLEKREEALRKSEMRFRAIIENVDDVKHAEQRLRESEARLRPHRA